MLNYVNFPVEPVESVFPLNLKPVEVGILSLDQPATAGFFAKVGLTASSPRETHCCILGLKGNA